MLDVDLLSGHPEAIDRVMADDFMSALANDRPIRLLNDGAVALVDLLPLVADLIETQRYLNDEAGLSLPGFPGFSFPGFLLSSGLGFPGLPLSPRLTFPCFSLPASLASLSPLASASLASLSPASLASRSLVAS